MVHEIPAEWLPVRCERKWPSGPIGWDCRACARSVCQEPPISQQLARASSCKVGQKLGEILYPLIHFFLPCLSWLLRSQFSKSRRDLRITLYITMHSPLNVKFGTTVTSANAAQFLSVRATVTVDCTICRQKRHVVPIRSEHKTLLCVGCYFWIFVVWMSGNWSVGTMFNPWKYILFMVKKKAMIFSCTL